MSININYWYRLIVIDDKVEQLDNCVDYFEAELMEAKEDCNVTGSVEQAGARLPGIFEHRFSQLQEIVAIREHMDIELRKMRSKHYRNYLESYNKTLSSRDAEKYIDGEPDIVVWTQSINRLVLMQNQYSGVVKALDHKNFQISNIVKLRTAGIEDASL